MQQKQFEKKILYLKDDHVGLLIYVFLNVYIRCTDTPYYTAKIRYTYIWLKRIYASVLHPRWLPPTILKFFILFNSMQLSSGKHT